MQMNLAALTFILIALLSTLNVHAKRVDVGGKRYECKHVQKSCVSDLLQGEVCATDGQIFPSLCELIRYLCSFDIDREGSCGFLPQTDETTTKAPRCIKCKDTTPASTGPMVCGTDGYTYKNECWLKRKSCQVKRQFGYEIDVDHEGQCEEPSESDGSHPAWMDSDYHYEEDSSS